MGNEVLAKELLSHSNELTESDVTELTSLLVDETTLAILRRQ